MRKYYLNVHPTYSGHYLVSISDRPECAVFEIEAKSYSEAAKRFSFIQRGCGKEAVLSIAPDGKPHCFNHKN